MYASYFGYLFSLTLSMTSYYLEVTMTYIPWSRDFALYLTISNRKTSYRSLKQTAGSTSCLWTTILVLFLNQNIYCDPLLEPSQWDSSNGGSQNMF